ncbi:MAG: glycosyltransferase [Devosia sp.]
MSKRVLIMVIGTQGDVQPFVALALALKKRGYEAAIASTTDFKDFITRHGVEFRDLGGDAQAFVQRPEFDLLMSRNAFHYAPGLMRDGIRVLREAAKRAWHAAQDADALVFQNIAGFGIDIAEALGIPSILAVFQPIYPTNEFPYFEFGLDPVDPVLYRFAREPFAKSPRLDPLINRLSYVLQQAQQAYWDYPRDQLRRAVLGLERRRKGNVYRGARGEPLVTLHAYSRAISPPAGDWPETNIITGFWRLEETAPWEPSPEFQAFLAAGTQPIYLGFGSMPWGAQRNGEIIQKAMAMWGGRIVIGAGWGGIKRETMPPSVHVIERAPHSKLFPMVKAVVHHGGAGTTHTGLLAGRPTFIVPQFFDQPYWGRLVYELGLGPRPVKARKLTPQILASALDDLATTPSFATAAAAMGERLRLEDGTNRAVDVIEETIADFRPRVERKTYLAGALP